MSMPVRVIQVAFKKWDPVLERCPIQVLDPDPVYNASRAPGDIWIEGDEQGAWVVSVFLAVDYFPPNKNESELKNNWSKWGSAAEREYRRKHPNVVFIDQRK